MGLSASKQKVPLSDAMQQRSIPMPSPAKLRCKEIILEKPSPADNMVITTFCSIKNSSSMKDDIGSHSKGYIDENCNIRSQSFRFAKEKASANFVKGGCRLSKSELKEPLAKRRRKRSLDYLNEPSIHGPVFFPRKSHSHQTTEHSPLNSSVIVSGDNMQKPVYSKMVRNLLTPSIHSTPITCENNMLAISGERALRSRNSLSNSFNVHANDVLHNDTEVIVTARLSLPELPCGSSILNCSSDDHLQMKQEPLSLGESDVIDHSSNEHNTPTIMRTSFPIFAPNIEYMIQNRPESHKSEQKQTEVITPSWFKVPDAEIERCQNEAFRGLRTRRSFVRVDNIDESEDLDDEKIIARHAKYVAEERRLDKLERRQQKEMEHRERWEKRMAQKSTGTSRVAEPPKRLPFPKSLCSYMHPVSVIHLTETLPVIAFGEGLPVIKAKPFKLIL